MAPGNVRTIPPWVIQRPPQAVAPQHNHAPSETRHGRDISDSSRDDAVHDDDNHTSNGSNGSNDSNANSSSPSGSKSNASGSGVANTNNGAPSGSRDGPASDGILTAADGVKDPAAPINVKYVIPKQSLRQRLSHLFLNMEGRRWDHLRSAEPVIVSQFHAVTRPTMHARQDSDFPEGAQSSLFGGRFDGGAAGPSDSSAPIATGTGIPQQSASTRRKPQTPLSPSDQKRHPWWYNPETQWRGFIESSRYPNLTNEKSAILNDEEMALMNPDFGFNSGLRARAGGGDGGAGIGHFTDKNNSSSQISNKPLYKRVWQTLLHHPLGPLACRLTVLMTSIVALVLAATIYRRERLGSLSSLGQGDRSSTDFDSVWLADRQQERTQVIVAIVVDVVAIPYIGYITADDYTGKPLGLRRPQERIRLLLTDLFFIIFKSASTALGFEAMIFFTTEGSEGLLRALGAFELIGLISWAMTLTINIFREIERLVGK